MRPPPQAETTECIFCDDDAIAEEHIFGRKWLAKLFRVPRKHKLGHVHHRGGEGAFGVWWNAREADLVVRCVCDRCNSGWMNVLDDRAQKLIQPLLDGGTMELRSLREVLTLAAWVMKLAMMFDYKQAEASIPIAVAREFYKRRVPPPRTRIWLTHSPSPADHHAAGYTWAIGEPGAWDLYLCAIRVMPFVAFVSLPLRKDVRLQFPSEGGAITHLWPPTGRAVKLPTAETLNDVEFVSLCQEYVRRHERASAVAAGRRI